MDDLHYEDDGVLDIYWVGGMEIHRSEIWLAFGVFCMQWRNNLESSSHLAMAFTACYRDSICEYNDMIYPRPCQGQKARQNIREMSDTNAENANPSEMVNSSVLWTTISSP